MSKKYLILGMGDHGKDYAAELFQEMYGLSFISSSFAACEKAVFPTLSKKYGYKSAQECYDDRRNHRVEWKALITEYNTPDKSRLCSEILELNDVYVGMRCHLEYAASKHLFHKIFYVDASIRKGVDSTMTIPYDIERMWRLDNNGTKEDLRQHIEMFGEGLLS